MKEAWILADYVLFASKVICRCVGRIEYSTWPPAAIHATKLTARSVDLTAVDRMRHSHLRHVPLLRGENDEL